MDCIFLPAAESFACTRCGWQVPDGLRPAAEAGELHRNCPIPEDPALIARRASRLAVCLACEFCFREPAVRPKPDDPPGSLGPYCLADRFSPGTSGESLCRLRGLLAALLVEEIRVCVKWPG